jgi:uncharacterized protein
MKDTLAHIISSIVTDPDAVQVEESEEEGITVFTVTVAKEDMGRVIGKEGKVIRSIRNIMKIPAIKQNKRINISLAENPQ